MDKIVEKIKEGCKFCKHTLSPDCLILAKSDRFVGNYCSPCFKLKTKVYYKKYVKDHPPKKKQPKINQTVNLVGKKDLDNILQFLADDNNDLD